MSKMIIYFYLLIPMFLSIDSSSIRGRNLKNDLVPLPSSRLDSVKKGSNSLKIVSSEPFYVQLQIPKSREDETREKKEKNKKKESAKKRVSKIKALRKKHRNRRDLLRSKTKTRQEKSNQLENLHAVSETEDKLKNDTKNAINRVEILKALSLHTKKKDIKRNKAEATKNIKDGVLNETKHNEYTSNRNHHNPQLPYTDRTPNDKMSYPSTPKSDLQPHKYTYQDLMADRERLEQKLKYIKNMLKVNDSTTDDTVRVRRKSDSDRTANKIAKMFLTLSAVNGLHDKRKSKCVKDDKDEDDRVQDVWEKERKNSLSKKSSSSNEERYKVKKWIEFMKKKRSSSKSCPCMTNVHGEEGDAFPLEQKLPKGYFLMERGRSSEESSESIRDSFPSSFDKQNKQSYRNQLQKSQEDQENRLKALSKNGKKKLELPFDDLELYRSRAKQILRNAEEILDRIKEEEEKRLAAPNILLSQLKELTSKIQGDPRNNENDLIRKIQKNLGWGPLAKSQEDGDKNSFVDNVKSFILDPYEKAKALTDESTKKLSSYLLRNLGKLQESSEQEEGRKADEETQKNNLQIFFAQVPQKEEKPLSANLAKGPDPLSKHKEDLQNWEETLSTILKGGDEPNLDDQQEEQYKQRMEEIIKEQQKKINEYKMTEDSENNSKELDGFGFKSLKDKIKTEKAEKKIIKESKPDKTADEDKTEKLEILELKKDNFGNFETPTNTYLTSEKPFLESKETFRSQKGETEIPASRNLQEEKEFDEEIEKTMKTLNEKDSVGDGQEARINFEEKQQSDDVVRNQEQENDKEPKEEPEIVETSSNIQTNSKENDKTNTEHGDVVASPHFLSDEDENFEAVPRFLTSLNDYFMYDSEKDFEIPEKPTESKSNEETVIQKQEKIKDDLTKPNFDQNMSSPLRDTTGLKEYNENATPPSQTQTFIEDETIDPSRNERTQMKVGSKKILEDTDQEKEPKQNSRFDQQSNEQPKDEIQTDEETLQSERQDNAQDDKTDEDVTEKDTPKTETLKAIDNKAFLENSMEIVENYSKIPKGNQKDINENLSLKVNPENEKNSNENVNLEKEETSIAKNDSSLLKATKYEETSEEDITDETVLGNKSRETWNAEDEEKTSKVEKPTKEVTNELSGKNTVNSSEEKRLKNINDEKTEHSYESDGTFLKATPNSQRDKNEVSEKATFEKTDNEVNEISLNQRANDTDDTHLEISLNKDDETPLKATNLKQTEDGKTEYSEEIGDKELLKENKDEYSYEKTFLKSEKTDDDGSQMKNLKTSDEESEIIRETSEKQNDKTSEESNETILKAVDLQDQETLTANEEATLKAEHPNNNLEFETPLRSDVKNQQQEESNEEIFLRKTNSAEVQDEKSSDNTLKAALDNQNEGNMEENQSFLRMEKTEKVQDEKSNDEAAKVALDDQNKEDETSLKMGKPSKVQDENPREKSSDETLKSTLDDQNEETEEADNIETSLRMEKSDEVRDEISEIKNSHETLKSTFDDRNGEKEEMNENETLLKKEKSDEIQNEKSGEETEKIALNDQTEEDETPLRMRKPGEIEDNSRQQSSDVTLKLTLDDQKDENETSLKKAKSDEIQDEKSSEETAKVVLDDQNEKDEISLRMIKPGEVQDENSREKSSDETLKSTLDDQNEETEEADNIETSLRMEKSDEVRDEISEIKSSDETLKSTFDDRKDENETSLKKAKSDKIQNEKRGEETEKIALNDQIEEDETPLRMRKPGEVEDDSRQQSSDETLKLTLDDQNEEKEEINENETLLKKEKSDEIQDEKSSEETAKFALDDQTEEDETPLRMRKPGEVEDDSRQQSSDETLKLTLDDQNEEKEEINENETFLKKEKSDEIQDEKSSEETAKFALDDQTEDETSLRMKKPSKIQDENSKENSSDETLKSTLDDQNEEIKEADNIETSLRMEKSDEVQDEISEVKSSDEILKEVLGVQKEENLKEIDEDKTNLRAEHDEDQIERNSNENDDILRSVINNETQESLNEEPDDETLKKGKLSGKKAKDGDKTDLKVALENQQQDNTQMMNSRDTSSQVNSNEDDQAAALDDQEGAKAENLRKPDDSTTYLKIQNLRTELNSQESTSDKPNSREDNNNLQETQDNFKEVDEALQDEIREKDQEDNGNDTETRLRSENFEDQLDNSIADDKTLLKSAKSTEETEKLKNSKKSDENKEIYREQNFDNRIDQKNQDETLRSLHFDEMNDRSEESLYNTLKAINPLDEESDRLETKPEDPRGELSSSDQLQKPGFTTKPFKTVNLKVPKSIGKIMEDLDGKKKDDVTSLQNLNPDKIDHIIDKIDEAEQQTLLTGQQVDCRKECACADEIDTKSRKIGRYEIAKDFLHWMKDLQLNRVLSDD